MSSLAEAPSQCSLAEVIERGTLNVPALLWHQCFPTPRPDPPTVWVRDLILGSNAQNPFHGRVPDMPVFSAEDYKYVYYLLTLFFLQLQIYTNEQSPL